MTSVNLKFQKINRKFEIILLWKNLAKVETLERKKSYSIIE